MPESTIPCLRDDALPGTLAEFIDEFSDDERCVAVLRRWKYGEHGFECPRCGGHESWYLESRKLDECQGCHKQVSLTAGTVMHSTRKPLRLWFLAMWRSTRPGKVDCGGANRGVRRWGIEAPL